MACESWSPDLVVEWHSRQPHGQPNLIEQVRVKVWRNVTTAKTQSGQKIFTNHGEYKIIMRQTSIQECKDAINEKKVESLLPNTQIWMAREADLLMTRDLSISEQEETTCVQEMSDSMKRDNLREQNGFGFESDCEREWRKLKQTKRHSIHEIAQVADYKMTPEWAGTCLRIMVRVSNRNESFWPWNRFEKVDSGAKL